MKPEIPLHIIPSHTLFDIIYQGIDRVARETDQPHSEVSYVSLSSETQNHPYITVQTTHDKGRMNKLDAAFWRFSNLSLDSLQKLLKQFGGNSYVNFEIHKSREERRKEKSQDDVKYGIMVSNPRIKTRNYGHLPEHMNKSDADNLSEFLNILGVAYQRNTNSLRVKPTQWRNRVTPQAQALAYHRALEKGLDVSLYSSTSTFSRRLSHVYLHGESANITREGYERDTLKKEDILEMQDFVEKHFGKIFHAQNWNVEFYALEDHTPLRDYHKTLILNES